MPGCHFASQFRYDASAQPLNNRHEEAGAAVVAPFFPSLVTECMRSHVAAKRYLCAWDPGYLHTLSRASVHSLQRQGGPMSAVEVQAFISRPTAAAVIRVRLWDDAAKVKAPPIPRFQRYVSLLQTLVDAA